MPAPRAGRARRRPEGPPDRRRLRSRGGEPAHPQLRDPAAVAGRASTRLAQAFLTEYAHSEDGGAETNDHAVDYVLVGGPYDAAGPGETDIQRRIFVCRPAADEPEEPCARRILQRLARHAYRRPVTAADIDPLLDLFAMGRADGERFEDGIEMALSGVLVSPSFLFRAPRPLRTTTEPGSAYPALGHRPGVAAVLLPVERHPGRGVARPRRTRPTARSGPCSTGRSPACWRTRRPGPWWRTSAASGCTCATSPTGRPTRCGSPTSTTRCATPSSARRSCFSTT